MTEWKLYIQFSSISPNAIAILIDFICSLVLVSTSVIANVNVWTFFFIFFLAIPAHWKN